MNLPLFMFHDMILYLETCFYLSLIYAQLLSYKTFDGAFSHVCRVCLDYEIMNSVDIFTFSFSFILSMVISIFDLKISKL